MRPTPEDLARALANKLKGRDVGYQCCLDGSESIGVIAKALSDARRAALADCTALIVKELGGIAASHQWVPLSSLIVKINLLNTGSQRASQ